MLALRRSGTRSRLTRSKYYNSSVVEKDFSIVQYFQTALASEGVAIVFLYNIDYLSEGIK